MNDKYLCAKCDKVHLQFDEFRSVKKDRKSINDSSTRNFLKVLFCFVLETQYTRIYIPINASIRITHFFVSQID